jgi:hypothetical protein
MADRLEPFSGEVVGLSLRARGKKGEDTRCSGRRYGIHRF